MTRFASLGMRREQFLYWAKVLTATTLVLAVGACKDDRIGGFIESAGDEGEIASIGGNFHCEADGPLDVRLWGQIQFQDHGFQIDYGMNGKTPYRDLAFHGDLDLDIELIERGPDIGCLLADFLWERVLREEGYCGLARLQPPPKASSPYYGEDIYYKVYVTDGGEPGPSNGDHVYVALGTDNELTGCPDDIFYENSGDLKGGNIQVFY